MTAPRRSPRSGKGQDPTEQLRRYILTRQAGDWLTQKGLRQELGGMPLRDLRRALGALRDEGLIEVFERVGIQVRTLTSREINSRIGIRRALEVEVTLALARVARTSEEGFLAPLEQVHAEMRAIAEGAEHKPIRRQDSDAFFEADERFHATICTLAGYDEAVGILGQVRQRLRLMATAPLQTPAAFQSVIDEHRAIVQAVQRGTAADIQQTVEAHLQKVTERWFPALQARPSTTVELPAPQRGGT